MSNATPQPRPVQPSVITLSSLVAGSQVGGAVTNAVLFAHGIRSQFLPTIILSRHPGLGAPGGGAVDTGLIKAALAGLAKHGRFAVADAVFTGYFTRPDQVEAAAEAIAAAKAERPDLLVMVDPIIGDGPADARDDRLYVSAQTAAAIRDRLVPLADVITPNRFELSWLSGKPIETEAEAVAAARALAPVTLVTSAPAPEGEIAVLVVEARDAARLTAPRQEGAPNGTGDLFAASALAARIEGADWRRAAGLAMGRVSHVLTATLATDPADLLLTPDTLTAPVLAPRPVRVGARRPAWVMGLDGCRGGWAAVMVDLNGLEAPQSALFETFDAALGWGAQVHAVDMPIGFEDQRSGAGGRVCEREARTRLGARRSSVFASPLRPALAATSHDQASALNRAAGGPGLSRQSFNLFPKMREIDALMTPDLARGVVFESHPELVFAVLSGAPATHKKSTPEGREARLALLAAEGLPRDLFDPHPFRRTQCAPDDLVDAGLCALTAIRIAEGRALCLPEDPPTDARGLVMAIHA